MTDFISLSKLLPFVPAAGGVVLVIAAIYSRGLLSALGRGLDKISALGKVPLRERLHTIEVFENVLKIDMIKTERLTADQRFRLIERTFEERTNTAKRRFFLLLAAAFIMLLFSTMWLYYSWTRDAGPDQVIADMLSKDGSRFSDALANEGFYNAKDERLVESLAKTTGFSEGRLNEAIVRFEKLENCHMAGDTDCNRSVSELRKRARRREAPFDEPGMFFDVGRSGGVQPRRFFINVTRNFPFKQSALEVRNPDNDRTLTLWPRVALTTETRPNLVHLNDQQITQLFTQAELLGPGGLASTIRIAIRPIMSENPQLTDPRCPRSWLGNDRLCGISGENILLDSLLDKLSA